MRYPAFGQMSHCGHNGSGYRNSLRSRGRNKYSVRDFIDNKLAKQVPSNDGHLLSPWVYQNLFF